LHRVCHRFRRCRLRRAGEYRQQTQRETRVLRGRSGRFQKDRRETHHLCLRSCIS
ncbi:hypothetical protein M9458_039231, partial [Cirrhinus mrigala]